MTVPFQVCSFWARIRSNSKFKHILCYLQSIMKRMTLLVAVMILMTGYIAAGAPLKAMLYCWLPAEDTDNPMPEYNRLASMINAKLKAADINVVVEVCDKNGNGQKLYISSQINSLFDDFDILEIDVAYFWAITTPLHTFTKNEISFFGKAQPYQWTATAINHKNGTRVFAGSPGLLCSDYLQTRQANDGGSFLGNLFGKGGYKNVTYADLSPESQFGLVTYYLNTYINGGPSRSLQNMDYSKVDDATIAKVAHFLKRCQVSQQFFDYENNFCIKYTNQKFFSTEYSTTIGYSENLYNFQIADVPKEKIKIEHVGKLWSKKLFYADSFIAKETADRATVLKFYEFMLSDEVLDIYVQGLYTNSPRTTYLLPPTIEYFKKMRESDPIYKEIFDTSFYHSRAIPISVPSFAQNVESFSKKIDEALKAYKEDIDL